MADEQDGRPSFWKTAPGFMTGVAALLTAVVTVLAFFGLGHSTSAEAPPPAETPGQVATGRPATAAATTPAAPAGDGQPLWQGELLLTNVVDFDTVPPDRNPPATAGDVSVNDMHQGPHTIETFNGGFRWDRAGDPNRSECAGKLAGFSTDSVLLDVGTRACVGTDGGRIVLIRVVKVNTDSYLINATVWAAP